MLNLKTLREKIQRDQFHISTHIQKRMLKRGITLNQILEVIQTGEILEQYPKRKPYPSCLVVSQEVLDEPLYVVCAFDGEIVYIITAHWMDPEKWIDPWTRRKKP